MFCTGKQSHVFYGQVTRQGCSPRIVKHVQWAEWPDHGVPKESGCVFKVLRNCAIMYGVKCSE